MRVGRRGTLLPLRWLTVVGLEGLYKPFPLAKGVALGRLEAFIHQAEIQRQLQVQGGLYEARVRVEKADLDGRQILETVAQRKVACHKGARQRLDVLDGVVAVLPQEVQADLVDDEDLAPEDAQLVDAVVVALEAGKSEAEEEMLETVE